jgi:formylglycine-generating enzyme required for sulfatase activity
MQRSEIGDYQVIKQIGQGPLGTVLLVMHRFMRRQFVLKVLPEELSQDRNFMQRFQDQVGNLSTLEHPNLVKIHNISYADGLYFLVTDCIVDELGETANLGQFLKGIDGNLSSAQIRSILTQVAGALEEGHSRGLVHGGIKLNNILISSKGSFKASVSDFGLTAIVGPGAVLLRSLKAVAEAHGCLNQLFPSNHDKERYPIPPVDSNKMTSISRSFLQTFAFLSPEQKQLRTLTPQTDAYAFGVLAYVLLTKQYPEGRYPKPSVIRGGEAREWDDLIEQCLSIYPEARPKSLVTAVDHLTIPSTSTFTPIPAPIITQPIAREPIRMEKIITVEAEEEVEAFETFDDQTPFTEEIEDVDEFIEEEKFVAVSQQRNFAQSNAQESASSATFAPTAIRMAPPSPQRINPSIQQRVQAQPVYIKSNDLKADLKGGEPKVADLKPIFQESEVARPEFDPDPMSAFRIDTTVKHYTPQEKGNVQIEPLLSDMVIIRGGNYIRGGTEGGRDEMPRHEVQLSSFALDIHPVTNEQYIRFLEVLGGEKDVNNNDVIRYRDSRIRKSGGKLLIESGYSKHPVVGVTWYGAVAYAKWVGKRLPTEAEWEVAAQGGEERRIFPTGDGVEKSQANFFSSDSTPVMSYPPFAFGVYDMCGNVYEWCLDWYDYNYYQVSVTEPDDPKGPLQGVYRVLRGGCWKSLPEDLRCSHRHRNNPGTFNSTYGFRCAADVM